MSAFLFCLNCLGIGVCFSLCWGIADKILLSDLEAWIQLLQLGWYCGVGVFNAANLLVIVGEEIDGRGCELTLLRDF